MSHLSSAACLKGKFDVFGHFYTVALSSGDVVACRSVLEIIVKKRKPADIDKLSRFQPDAVFIMMNPGSSVPLRSVNNLVSYGELGSLVILLVPAKPDTTQYQLMRVMDRLGWSHVRVLNLSDIRESQSTTFIDYFQDLENILKYSSHSIFSEDRKDELKYKLRRRCAAPLVFAWGVNPRLDQLITRCIEGVGHVPWSTGLLKPGTNDKYRHPLPRLQRDKELWVNDMTTLLRSVSRWCIFRMKLRVLINKLLQSKFWPVRPPDKHG